MILYIFCAPFIWSFSYYFRDYFCWIYVYYVAEFCGEKKNTHNNKQGQIRNKHQDPQQTPNATTIALPVVSSRLLMTYWALQWFWQMARNMGECTTGRTNGLDKQVCFHHLLIGSNMHQTMWTSYCMCTWVYGVRSHFCISIKLCQNPLLCQSGAM